MYMFIICKKILKTSPVPGDTAVFSVKILHTNLVSPHSHSLKDVQAALSLTGWMQDIKHRNETLGKTQCWINI